MGPVYEYSLARENISTVAKNPQSIFFVGEKGKIEAISKYNVIGRFWCWITGKSDVKRVREAIDKSVASVFTHFEGADFSFHDLKHDVERVKNMSIVDKAIHDKIETLLKDKINPEAENLRRLGQAVFKQESPQQPK